MRFSLTGRVRSKEGWAGVDDASRRAVARWPCRIADRLERLRRKRRETVGGSLSGAGVPDSDMFLGTTTVVSARMMGLKWTAQSPHARHGQVPTFPTSGGVGVGTAWRNAQGRSGVVPKEAESAQLSLLVLVSFSFDFSRGGDQTT
jgi:hypothetical protein